MISVECEIKAKMVRVPFSFQLPIFTCLQLRLGSASGRTGVRIHTPSLPTLPWPWPFIYKSVTAEKPSLALTSKLTFKAQDWSAGGTPAVLPAEHFN